MEGKDIVIAFLALAVVVLTGAVSFLGLRDPLVRDYLAKNTSINVKELEASLEKSQQAASNLEKATDNLQAATEKLETAVINQPSTPVPEVEPEPKVYHQYFDADEAFAKDELFAVTSKQKIPEKRYTDNFDKNVFGRPKEKSHPPVYIIRCMGRETRENYLFIVPREVHDRVNIYQKFTKTQMSNYEYFLSEERLNQEVFSRRFKNKMID